MENSNQENLFKKYIADNCTEEEKAIVEGWYLNELKNESVRPTIEQIDLAKTSAWHNLRPKSSKLPRFKWVVYAAAAVIAVMVIYNFQAPNPSVSNSNATKFAASEAEEKNTLFASKVENSMVKLPDGSIVILEKGSKITMLNSFGEKERSLKLVGKAFFDIAHDANKPFIIYSGDIKTTVLGTSFDIDATPGIATVKINVIRGKVRVERDNKALGILTKDMQIVYDNESEEVAVKHVNAEKELAWNKQDLEFNDISIEDARVRLENQFGYKILVKDTELGKQTFHYSMRAKESPESFINSICAFIGGTYTIDHKNKIISIKPLNQ